MKLKPKTETDVHFVWLLVADARTLDSHLEKVQAPVSLYTSELTIDLAEWDVEPRQVSVAFDRALSSSGCVFCRCRCHVKWVSRTTLTYSV